jgi:FKBP-type peptidyl-prolyl cis-trans isomerase FkpA
MGPLMSNQPSGPRRIALSLSLLAAALPALALAQAAKPAAAPASNPEILPVPLSPLVPAAQRQCSARTASGLGTRVLRESAGPKPGAGDYVLVNYIGYLAADGSVFDQNVSQAFTTDAVIKGFSEGMLLMNKGSVWRFCIPAVLGYGEKGGGPIPANSDLVFQVELIDSKTVAEVSAMRAQAEREAQQQAQPAPGQATVVPAPAASSPPPPR